MLARPLLGFVVVLGLVAVVAVTEVAPVSASQPLATLTVELTNLRNARRQLIFGVFTSADGFPGEEGKSSAAFSPVPMIQRA